MGRSSRRRTSPPRRRYTVTWPALPTHKTSSLCLTRWRTWSSPTTSAAAAYTRNYRLQGVGSLRRPAKALYYYLFCDSKNSAAAPLVGRPRGWRRRDVQSDQTAAHRRLSLSAQTLDRTLFMLENSETLVWLTFILKAKRIYILHYIYYRNES